MISMSPPIPVVTVVTYDLNDFERDHSILEPSNLYQVAVAAACSSSGGKTTSFAAKFVDPSHSAAVQETWIFKHSTNATDVKVSNFIKTFNSLHISEFAAIAVVVSTLFKRESIRVREVMKIGQRSDYFLEDTSGNDAGTIEISGMKRKHASNKTNQKRIQAAKTKACVRRIGVVAFGGPEYVIEKLS